MTINLPKTARIGLVVLALALMPRTQAFAAASIGFDPSSASVREGDQVTATVTINTGGAKVTTADVILRYPAADLEFVSAANGGFFPLFNYANDATAGQTELHASFPMATFNNAYTGSFATVTFRARKGSGTGSVGFVCTGSGADSIVVDDSYTNNILVCTSLPSFGLTYTPLTNPTNTPTSTPVPNSTPTPTLRTIPTNTPTSAPGVNRKPSCSGLSVLPAGTLTTATGITLTCAGNDPDGWIRSAEFFYGDGTIPTTVEKSGNNTSISSKHYYTKTGSYTAGCKVIDNSSEKSDMPLICTYSFTVKAAPAGSVKKLPTATLKPGAKSPVTAPTATSAPVFATLAPYATPTPVSMDSLTGGDDRTGQQEEKTGPNWQILLIIALVGILLIIGIIVLIRKLTDRHDQPPILEPPTPVTGGPPISY